MVVSKILFDFSRRSTTYLWRWSLDDPSLTQICPKDWSHLGIVSFAPRTPASLPVELRRDGAGGASLCSKIYSAGSFAWNQQNGSEDIRLTSVKGKFLIQCNVHSGNVAMENGPGMTKMYLLLKTGIFHCYVSLPVGSCFIMDDQKKKTASTRQTYCPILRLGTHPRHLDCIWMDFHVWTNLAIRWEPLPEFYPYHPWDWYIYLHLVHFYGFHGGKYTSPMDP